MENTETMVKCSEKVAKWGRLIKIDDPVFTGRLFLQQNEMLNQNEVNGVGILTIDTQSFRACTTNETIFVEVREGQWLKFAESLFNAYWWKEGDRNGNYKEIISQNLYSTVFEMEVISNFWREPFLKVITLLSQSEIKKINYKPLDFQEAYENAPLQKAREFEFSDLALR